MTGDRVYRRKACDLCAKKKIKCNYDLPVCANCLSYGVECKISATVKARNKPSSARRDGRGRNGNPPLAPKNAEVPPAAQQADIQAKLDKILNSLRSTAAAPPHNDDGTHTAMAQTQTLPPLEVVLPAIEHFFKTLNSHIPIFYEPTFMRMLTTQYSQPLHHGDDATLSAILVVVALSYSMSNVHSIFYGVHTVGSGQRETLARFISEIERMFFHVMTKENGLIVVQLASAMACYFNCVGHMRKANAFIGVAIRLACQLQMHSRQPLALPSTREEQEESIRTFWSIYILEKEISFRLKIPSMLLEAEIDIPYPSLEVTDSPGLITSGNKQYSFNILRSRIKLGQLQDGIYQLLYSVRSQGAEHAPVQSGVDVLAERLEEWFSEIPTAFHLDSDILDTLKGIDRLSILKIHLEYLSKLISIHGVLSPNAEWIQSLSSLSKTAIQESIITMVGRAKADCAQRLGPPSTGAWHTCVKLGLQCVRHFRWALDVDPSVWKHGEAFCSVIIIVLADQLRPLPDIHISEGDYAEIMNVVGRLKELPSTDSVFDTHTSHLQLVVDELCSKLEEKLLTMSLTLSSSSHAMTGFPDNNNLQLELQEWSDMGSEAIF